jgi:hypothetical protein
MKPSALLVVEFLYSHPWWTLVYVFAIAAGLGGMGARISITKG